MGVVLLCLGRGRPAGRDGDAKPLLETPATGAYVAKARQKPWTFQSLFTTARFAN